MNTEPGEPVFRLSRVSNSQELLGLVREQPNREEVI